MHLLFTRDKSDPRNICHRASPDRGLPRSCDVTSNLPRKKNCSCTLWCEKKDAYSNRIAESRRRLYIYRNCEKIWCRPSIYVLSNHPQRLRLVSFRCGFCPRIPSQSSHTRKRSSALPCRIVMAMNCGLHFSPSGIHARLRAACDTVVL
jgi:hypothetical protein